MRALAACVQARLHAPYNQSDEFSELSKRKAPFSFAIFTVLLYTVFTKPKEDGKMEKFLNDLYYKTLDKPKWRNALNNFLFFFVWKIAFLLFSIKGVDKKLILFVASHDYKPAEEYKALYEKAKQNGYRCVCLYQFKGGSKIKFKNELSKIKSDLVFQKYYARARTTFLYEYYLPAYANKPRKGTELVQLWHGCGAFKKFSYSLKDSSWGLEGSLFEKYSVHKNYTAVVSSSESIIPQYAEAFSVSESIIKPVGVPRTDVFFESTFTKESREKLLERFPALESKKLILWAPTFRGNDMQSSYNEKAVDFLSLKEKLGSGYALLIKLHPLVKNRFAFTEQEEKLLDGFAVDISDMPISTVLCCADLLVADYSSLIFEYALLARPMVFYAYDLDRYNSERSFYYDYESFVPGEIVKTNEELAEAIKRAEESYDYEKLERFREKFMSACDGNSTQRVFDLFIASD